MAVNELALRLLVFSAITVACAWIGGLVPLQFRWKRDQLWLLISFGAGVLLGAAFLHMLPDAFDLVGSSASGLVFVGFLVLFFIEKFVMVHACGAHDCEYHTIGVAAFVGLSIHSMMAGIALGSAAAIPGLGAVVLLAIVAHKAPASMSLAALLIAAGYRRGAIIALISVFSLMVPLGVIVAYFILGAVPEHVVGVLVALSAGTFLYIAASDLLPELHRAQQLRTLSLVTFFGGVLLTWGARVLGA